MRTALLMLMLATGPAWAGSPGVDHDAIAVTPVDTAPAPAAEAWIATYRLHDARGTRELVVACTDDTIELRVAGDPVRVWQRRADGVEHRQLFLDEGREVVFAPGDLRAIGREAAWNDVRGLVPARVVSRAAASTPRVLGHDARRVHGVDDDARAELTWLDDARLPARYMRGAMQLTLRTLERVPASIAFTSDDGLRAMDGADLGDESLDPFARRFIVQGFRAASTRAPL